MSRRRRSAVALVTLIGLIASGAACSGSSGDEVLPGDDAEQADRPDKEVAVDDQPTSDGFEPAPLEFAGCGSGVECATLEVPLDYEEPDGERMHLSLVRIPAGGPDSRIGALLINPGGPGGSGVDFARSFRFADDIHDRFDVIGFDPRGVGESGGLTCGGELVDDFFGLDSDPDTPDEQTQLEAAAEAIASDCGTDHGDLLAHVGTDDVVRDMDTIRRALGEDQISYFGFSYGTLLGVRYAELFPEGGRAIVLDGVVDPSHDFREWLTAQTRGFERAIAAVFAACEQDPSCPDGGAAAAYDQILARVEADPLPVDGSTRLGPGDLATAAIYATYDPGAWSSLFAGLADGLDGDGSGLFSLAESYRAFGGFTSYAAVVCVDSDHPTGAAEARQFAVELEAISPRFGPAIANELLPCAFWPVPPVGDPQPVTADGAPPVLVIGNTGDAATPFEQAQRVADTLAAGVLLTYEGEGHTSYGSSPCVDDAVAAYLVDLSLPAEDTVCT
ncbi:MAG: alpha/beta hydrolase [Acidimicrobiales bacterium]